MYSEWLAYRAKKRLEHDNKNPGAPYPEPYKLTSDEIFWMRPIPAAIDRAYDKVAESAFMMKIKEKLIGAGNIID